MMSGKPQLPAGCSVRRQLVGYQRTWSNALLEQFAHELQGGGLIPAGLCENVQDLALAIHGWRCHIKQVKATSAISPGGLSH